MSLLVIGVGNAGVAFTPNSIAGLVGWYDANALSGYVNGDSVSSWTDISGGRTAVNSSVGEQPAYVTGAQNGRPVVRFDGTSDRLQATSFQDAFVGTTSATVFVAFAVGPGASSDTEYSVLDFGANDGFYRFAGDGAGYLSDFRTARITAEPIGQPTSGSHYMTIRTGSSGYEVYRNSSLVESTGASWGIGANLTIGDNPVSAGVDFAGDVFEVIYYNSQLSTSQIQQVGDYLVDKWGL